MFRLLGIGDSMCDKNLTTGIMYPGGQSLNVPVNIHLQGGIGAFMGCFGNDAVASHLKRTLDELGIDHSHARSYPVPHWAAYYRVIDEDRVFLKAPVKVHPMSRVLFDMLAYEGFSEKDWAYISSFDMVHCSNDSRIETLYPEIKRRGVMLSFDFSTTHTQPGYMEQVCPFASVALLSCAHCTQEEAQAALEKAHALGTPVAVATMGTQGSLCFDGTRFYHQDSVLLEHVVDTMGAGDAFISAFLISYFGGRGSALGDIPSSLAYAARYAADRCMVNGSFGYGVAFETGSGCRR